MSTIMLRQAQIETDLSKPIPVEGQFTGIEPFVKNAVIVPSHNSRAIRSSEKCIWIFWTH